MKSKTLKRISALLLALLLLTVSQGANTNTAQAAAQGMVYGYSKMIENNGEIYYIRSTEGITDTYDIHRLNPKTGTNLMIASSTTYITDLEIYNNTLYYTSDIPGSTDYMTYSVSVDGGTPQSLFKGIVCYADENGIYYTVNDGDHCLLYTKAYTDTDAVLLYTGNSSFQYVKNINNTLYFGQFNSSSSQIKLLTLKTGKAKLSALSTLKISTETSSTPVISDVVTIKGNIYYQFGTYEGSGGFWYGTLVKFDTAIRKSSVITKNMISPVIDYSNTKIYYDDMQEFSKHYTYNTASGKTSTYTCKPEDSAYLTVQGGYTFSTKSVGMKYITVSRFTSGTNYKNNINNFIKLPFPQDKKLSYVPGIKSLGDYLLLSVTCIDYDDSSYGWRGNTLKINWYVADHNGKVLTHFE